MHAHAKTEFVDDPDREIFSWQYPHLGLDELPRELSIIELEAFFRLSEKEIAAIRKRFRDRHQILAALQLGFIKMTGNFLNATFVIPRNLFSFLARQLQLGTTVRIGSLKGIYERAATLHDHRIWVLEASGFQKCDDEHFANVQPFLKREAANLTAVEELVEAAKRWMYKNRYLSRPTREYLDVAREVMDATNEDFYKLIASQVSEELFITWEFELNKKRPDGTISNLQWLKTAPKDGRPTSLEVRTAKIAFLKSMGIQKIDLASVPHEKMRVYAEHLDSVKPSSYKRWETILRRIRLTCFLKIALLQENDTAVIMGDRRLAELLRVARRAADKNQINAAIYLRKFVDELFERSDDPTISDAELGAWVRSVRARDEAVGFRSRAEATRWAMTEQVKQMRPLLSELMKLDLRSIEDEALVKEASELSRLIKEGHSELPEGFAHSSPRGWRKLIEGEDRQRAMAALTAATLFKLRTKIRSGAVFIEDSEQFRGRHRLMIPKDVWERDRIVRYGELGLPLDGEKFLASILSDLRVRLPLLASAAKAGEIKICERKKGGKYISVKKVRAEKGVDLNAKDEKEALFLTIGRVQLPDLLMIMDSRTGWHSAILRGKVARNRLQLLKLYAGLIAHACALDATQVSLMIPDLTAAQVLSGMKYFEDKVCVKAANEIIVSVQKALLIAKLFWGDGSVASADMMSLDVSRKLWLARMDPSRKHKSIGHYVGLTDFWSIFFNLPVLINQWQAGPALEGLLRSKDVEVRTLSVDTHGYTHAAMALFKMCGYNLHPRLANVGSLKLYLPQNFEEVDPEVLPICQLDVSTKLILEQYDELVRLTASMKTGHVAADVALARFGSAASDSPLYKAAQALGKLLRTLYLCDYHTNEVLRRGVNRILVHGESVHQMQRAIYTGSHSKPRGKTMRELFATSGSLALITNLCLAFNAMEMQNALFGNIPLEEIDLEEFEWLEHTSPGHDSHINFGGTFLFDLDRFFSEITRNFRASAVA